MNVCTEPNVSARKPVCLVAHRFSNDYLCIAFYSINQNRPLTPK